MTIVKLRSGGIWVHAPIAPTKECIQLIKELGAPVEHIVLATFAYEHKIFLDPFSRKFPRAQPPDCISKESSLAAAKNGLAVKILSKGREVPHDPVEDNKLNRQTAAECAEIWN
ncbi:hypothetical protein D1007_48973 [Hordeum vulgare]|nr:hypothetical protein D1007_48973 [Hordeum vulgare]